MSTTHSSRPRCFQLWDIHDSCRQKEQINHATTIILRIVSSGIEVIFKQERVALTVYVTNSMTASGRARWGSVCSISAYNRLVEAVYWKQEKRMVTQGTRNALYLRTRCRVIIEGMEWVEIWAQCLFSVIYTYLQSHNAYACSTLVDGLLDDAIHLSWDSGQSPLWLPR